MVMGYTYEILYFYLLLLSGGLTILYALIGGVFDVDADGIFSPVLLLAFTTFLSATGFLLEAYTGLSSLVVLLMAVGVAWFLSFLSYHFVLIPLKGAQQSLVFKEKSLEGKVATVITSIPIDGFGEIIIKNESGTISKTAASLEGDSIDAGETVMIFELKNRVAYVIPYKPFELK